MKEDGLVLYDQMRAAIAQCAAVDEVAGLKERAAQLEAYARVRDDGEAQRQFAEIRLRACMRIGELSRELEKAKPGGAINGKKGGSRTTSESPSKFKQLAQAGINERTALRYEELTGGSEKHKFKTAAAAAETYLSEQKENGSSPSMSGLRRAVFKALDNTFGPVPPRKKPAPLPKPDHRFIHFIGPIRTFIERRAEYDAKFFATEEMDFMVESDRAACAEYVSFIKEFIRETNKLFPIK